MQRNGGVHVSFHEPLAVVLEDENGQQQAGVGGGGFGHQYQHPGSRVRNGSSASLESSVSSASTQEHLFQRTEKCKVKIYKVSNMQRCPYIHEMKERLLSDQQMAPPTPPPPAPSAATANNNSTVNEINPARASATAPDQQHPSSAIAPAHNNMVDQAPYHHSYHPHHPQTVGTVVKLNADGYAHTSPTHRRADRAPLVPKDPDCGDSPYLDKSIYPKNAKTSLFIIMSFVYAKLLIVVCVAYVISDVVTHNIPLWYYEGFFTYLYGVSILFLLYVFCFLLQESSCCSGGTPSGGGSPEKEPKRAKKEKAAKAKDAAAKEKEKEKERKKEEKEKARKDEKDKKKDKKEDKASKEGGKEGKDGKKKDKKGADNNKREVFPRKMKDKYGVALARAKALNNQDTTTTAAAGADTAVVPAPPQGPPPSVVLAAQQQQDVEAGISSMSAAAAAAASARTCKRKRKTTQNDQSHGSFFLRIGAIAFGLGTMIYSGLEFGSWFEIPFHSPCYMILKGINPALQMVFTFMQMYFIFMNSRLNIHRFKVIARFGLMHVVATNICVWIRTLVLEYLKEITVYHKKMNDTYPESIRAHTLRNANTILGTRLAVPDLITSTTTSSTTTTTTAAPLAQLREIFTAAAASTLQSFTTPPTTTTTDGVTMPPPTTMQRLYSTRRPYPTTPETLWRSFRASPSPYVFPLTTNGTTSTTPISTTIATTARRFWNTLASTLPTTTTTTTTLPSTTSTTTTTTILPPMLSSRNQRIADYAAEAAAAASAGLNRMATNTVTNADSAVDALESSGFGSFNGTELLDNILPQSLFGFHWNGTSEYPDNFNNSMIAASCGRVNIMGTIVQDSTPYLFPFIIEYSLIGAAVIYVMWKHIGRNPRYMSEEDLEHRLEVMLSRRAVAMAQHAQNGRVDCVGASKGLFFGLLLLVGSLICLILFFVLIHHPDLRRLAIYLADVSHCALMALSIIAIIVGFIRVQGLKFKVEEQSDLNDILLRVSAFGLFLYATFSVIAGSLNAFTKEPNLLVMVTGVLSCVQVVLQLLFIADVSRRRVHLPEHDRSKPGRQVVTFLLICNITMWIIYTFEMQKVEANPVQLEFYGYLAWAIVQRITLPLCIFHRFHSAVTLAEIWKTSYKARLE